MCGGTPIWAAEVEPYPIAVTTSRFPNMKHLGSVTEVRGDVVEPVDVLCFGAPCQDLSVAGLRKGLRHDSLGDGETTRSGLFMEAVRIIKEMREATNGVYPRFAIYENVPGAFSSSGGEDFRTVLEELIKVVEPTAVMPEVPKNGWPYADSYCGEGWSIAYRVLDAQYWGVPQRRRRIYLVADFRGECAGKVLFEPDGLSRHFTEGRTPWQTAAGDAEASPGTADCEGKCYAIDHAITTGGNCTAQGSCVYEDIQATLKAGGTHAVCYAESGTNGSQVSNTLVASMGNAPTGTTQDNLFVRINYIVRRLTPTECARLQGFPDTWGHPDEKTEFTDEEYQFWLNVRNTHAAINGKATKEYTKDQMLKWYNGLHTDSSEYKMWGNGIALPNALYVMQGIADVMTDEKTARRKWLDELLGGCL
jgi:DNA (cytosine-5)-methyltransferase 1